VNNTVDSDEDDMEADAMDLEREEMRRSAVTRTLGSLRVLMVILYGCLVLALPRRRTS